MTDLVIDLNDFAAADTANMDVRIGGRPIGWTWTFAGPGHPKTVEQGNRIARQALKEARRKQEAAVNGKKWHADDEDIEDIRRRNVDFVVERLVDWSAIKVAGADGKPVDFPFTADNARSLLSDPAKAGLLEQAYSFLADDENFTRR